ncbi:hypothetical protein Q9966_015096 [Columba livia]|nr:hypothetical protein Q9966_015096 [Columba livia]
MFWVDSVFSAAFVECHVHRHCFSKGSVTRSHGARMKTGAQAEVICFALVEDAVDSGLYLQTSSCVGNCSVNQPMFLTTENSMAV